MGKEDQVARGKNSGRAEVIERAPERNGTSEKEVECGEDSLAGKPSRRRVNRVEGTAKQEEAEGGKVRPGAADGGKEEAEEEEEEDEDEEEEEDSHSDSENASESSQEVSWIQWFCSLQGNEFFTDVAEDFVQDEFNLTGLGIQVPYYDFALDIILDIETPQDEVLTEEQQELVESAAEILYGLIHARYILTQRGILQMVDKYKRLEFGRCPRVMCDGQGVLPVGQSDQPQKHTVKVYCPRCNELFYPRSSKNRATDGAYFGTSFPHLLVMAFPELAPSPPPAYVPRIFGFKLHPDALPQVQLRKAKSSKGKIAAKDGTPKA